MKQILPKMKNRRSIIFGIIPSLSYGTIFNIVLQYVKSECKLYSGGLSIEGVQFRNFISKLNKLRSLFCADCYSQVKISEKYFGTFFFTFCFNMNINEAKLLLFHIIHFFLDLQFYSLVLGSASLQFAKSKGFSFPCVWLPAHTIYHFTYHKRAKHTSSQSVTIFKRLNCQKTNFPKSFVSRKKFTPFWHVWLQVYLDKTPENLYILQDV